MVRVIFVCFLLYAFHRQRRSFYPRLANRSVLRYNKQEYMAAWPHGGIYDRCHPKGYPGARHAAAGSAPDESGVRIGRTPGQDADVLTLVGDTWRLDPEGLLALPYVLDVRRITPPYRLAGRAAHPENTVVEVGSARIGAEFCLIAGPCAVESQVQMAGVAGG